MVKDNRFYSIDFLKIFGCLTVVLYHMCSAGYGMFTSGQIQLFHDFRYIFNSGWLSVELFFLISGVFFALRTDFSRNIIDFFKAKIKRLYPVFIFALLIGFVLSLFHIVPFNIYNALLNFFGLLGTPLTRGLCNYSEIHVFWYVACMLWTFALYYYIIQNLDKKWSNFVIAIIVFFSYAILVLNHWTVPYTIFGIFSTGILRALGGVGVGYFLGNIYKKIENTEINLLKKVKYTILEGACIYFIIDSVLFYNQNIRNNMIYILMFAAIVFLFMIKRGFISRILDRKIFGFWAKYTYPIYIVHGLLVLVLHNTLWKTQKEYMMNYPWESFFLSLLIMIVCGIIAYHICDIIVKWYLKKDKHSN